MIILSGCSSEEKDWEKAAKENTLGAYSHFLAEHPEGNFANDAKQKIDEIYYEKAEKEDSIRAYVNFIRLRGSNSPVAIRAHRKIYSRLQSLDSIMDYEKYMMDFPQGPFVNDVRQLLEGYYSERHPSFRDIKKIRVLLKEDGDIKGPHVYERMVQSLFGYAGVEAVYDNNEPCKAALEIRVSTRARGAAYKEVGAATGGSSFRYTGASVEGDILLFLSDGLEKQKKFKGDSMPLNRFTESEKAKKYESPSSDFLWGALIDSGSFVTKTLEIIREIFGFSSLNRAWSLEKEDSLFRLRAAEVIALREEEDVEIIEPLIDALNRDCSVRARRMASIKLKKITGIDYEDLQGLWRDWWEKNKAALKKNN